MSEKTKALVITGISLIALIISLGVSHQDWEVSCVMPFVKQTSDGYFSLGIKLSVPEWNGEQ